MVNYKAKVPKHVGIILDGNRRWAKQRGLSPIEGHKAGVENFRAIVEECYRQGVEYVSGYVFSSENWNRSEQEVKQLMSLVGRVFKKYVGEFNQQGLRVVVLGTRETLPVKLQKIINDSEQLTKNNQKGTLALCFNYGGHQEIVDMTKQIVAKGAKKEDVNEGLVEQNLYSPEVPSLDLLIRTSGEQRLSGFMLYRAAYAELYFSPKLWPDFGVADLQEAFADYAQRKRRFGA